MPRRQSGLRDAERPCWIYKRAVLADARRLAAQDASQRPTGDDGVREDEKQEEGEEGEDGAGRWRRSAQERQRGDWDR